MADTKLQDVSNRLSKAHGNGILRREIWVDSNGKVTRYNLAYINHEIFQGDNGRVLGYDNAHGFHHRHYMGKVVPIDFTSLEDIEDRFESDWMVFRRKDKKCEP
jgi:hypothetical protein